MAEGLVADGLAVKALAVNGRVAGQSRAPHLEFL
jgi:hypothetical protein